MEDLVAKLKDTDDFMGDLTERKQCDIGYRLAELTSAIRYMDYLALKSRPPCPDPRLKGILARTGP